MGPAVVAAGVWGIRRLLARLAPSRLREAEDLLPPGTGPDKKRMVLESLRPFLEQLATAGLAEAIPDDSVIGQILEEILTAEKAKSDWKEKGVLSVGGKKFEVWVIREIGGA